MTVKFQTGHKRTCGGRDWTRDQSGAISHKAGEKGLLDMSVLSQGQLGVIRVPLEIVMGTFVPFHTVRIC